MDKRLAKRHKRQVSRAKDQIRLSEPDVRTPEQLKAARETSRAVTGFHNDPQAHYSNQPIRNSTGPAAESGESERSGP